MAGAKYHAPDDRHTAWETDEVDSWIAESAPIIEDATADVDAAFATIGGGSEFRSVAGTTL